MFALISIAIIATCDGWGGSIHQEITVIALSHLSRDKVARRYLREHFGDNQNIITASTWADTDEAASAYPGSEDLHFSSTPWRQCSEFNMTRDCGFEGSGRCIVSGIADFVMVAIDHHQSLPKRVDAIKFLLHLVADIHQPLHTGFAEDNGGANIKLATDPVLSLHQMWDYGIWENGSVDKGRSDELGYVPVDVTLHGRLRSRDSVIDFATALASESSSMLTCTFAYRNEAGSFIKSRQSLSDEYMSSRRAIIASRIELAGKRLANLISVIATSFQKNIEEGKRAGLIAAPATEPVRPRNLYELLPIEFEPDDYILTVTSELQEEPSASESSHNQEKTPQTAEDVESIPVAEPAKIGKALLSDITLVNRRERYIVTCRSILSVYANIDDYDPIRVHHFRVRFSKNRKRTEPIVFFADVACFGFSLTPNDFFKALYFLSGRKDYTLVPENPGSLISVHSDLKKDTSDIHPIHGEYVGRSDATLRIYRGWNRLYLDEPGPIRYYLKFMEESRSRDLMAQYESATAHNKTIYEKWDLDFYSKLRDIVVYTYGKMQIFVNRNTLMNKTQPEMRFVIYDGVFDTPSNNPDRIHAGLGEDASIIVLIDTEIFSGLITERIIKGLNSIVKKTLIPDTACFARPSFLLEVLDIHSILEGKGRYRADQFGAIQAFYMMHHPATSNIAYIEWSILPTVIQVRNETQ